MDQGNSLEVTAGSKGEDEVRATYPAQENSHRLFFFFFPDRQASFLSKHKQEATYKENSPAVNFKSCKRKNIINCFRQRTCDTYVTKEEILATEKKAIPLDIM